MPRWTRFAIFGFCSVVVVNCGSCGTMLKNQRTGLDYVCHTVECPPRAEVVRAVSVFADSECGDGFNRDSFLEVHWFESEHVFVSPTGSRSVGRTWSRSEVEVTSFSTLFHELLHVHYWRLDGDPDRDHAEGDGPWKETDEDCIRSARLAAGFT